MSKFILTDKMIENAKQMIVNLEVAKTMDRKTQTRRLIKEKFYYSLTTENRKLPYIEEYIKGFVTENAKYQIDEIYWIREPARVSKLNDTKNGKLIFEYCADDDLKPTDKKYQVNLYSINMPDRFIRFSDRATTIYSKWITNCQGIPNGCIKEMARTFLKVTNVRVERLKDISWEDAKAEGGEATYYNDDRCPETGMPASDYTPSFKKIWEKTAPKGYKWEDNPYVFVYEFERVEK